MASETNELTFVRCPTCRSLVPASASRCRICNATLDTGAKGPAGEAPGPLGGRVRQKTVTAGPEEVKGIVAASVAPPPSMPTASAPESSPPASATPVRDRMHAAAAKPEVDEVFDPLGAFLQDLDSPLGSDAEPSNPEPRQVKESTVNLFNDDDSDDNDDDHDDDIDNLDLDDFDDPLIDDPLLGEPEKDVPLAVQESSVELQKPQEVPEDEEDEEDEGLQPQEKPSFFFDSLEDEPAVGPRREAPKPASAAPRKEPTQRDAALPPEAKKPKNLDPHLSAGHATRPVQSSPAARPGSGNIRPKIGGLPQRADGPSGAVRAALTNQEQTSPSTRVAGPRETAGRAESYAPQRQQRPNAPQKQSAQQSVSQMRARPDAIPPAAQSRHVAERSTELAESAGARASKTKQGRLFGWLVSYENPDGRAIELRIGRFFVTGTSIRPTDLILEDQSISTPHALMAITDSGLQVQDLMSERGTFVRCHGEGQYRREDGVVEIRHGDWIRFGDVEFLVTVVPS